MSDFYDPRAPKSGPRPRKNFRSKGECPDCGVADGEVHLETCELRSRYIG